ncbi:hypothetical protein CITFRE_08580 [Citrobacter freundii]|nr:hypothetical protein CITFRE_08580 [Citrobacter freundii]
MNTFFRLTALAGLLALAGQALAVEDITRADQIPVLKEETQHATVSERVTSRFTRSHYRQFDLDQAFSAKIFDRYLNLLDYSHNVLLASDIEQYAKKKRSSAMNYAPASWMSFTISIIWRKNADLNVISTH